MTSSGPSDKILKLYKNVEIRYFYKFVFEEHGKNFHGSKQSLSLKNFKQKQICPFSEISYILRYVCRKQLSLGQTKVTSNNYDMNKINLFGLAFDAHRNDSETNFKPLN